MALKIQKWEIVETRPGWARQRRVSTFHSTAACAIGMLRMAAIDKMIKYKQVTELFQATCPGWSWKLYYSYKSQIHPNTMDTRLFSTLTLELITAKDAKK